MAGDAKLVRMPLPWPAPARLASFYFAFFAYAGVFVAYFPLYLAGRGLNAGEIALLLALPQIARVFAPAAWGWLADRSGAPRGIVAFSGAAAAMCGAALPFPAPPARGALRLGALSVPPA